jgi:RNA polymerase sigma-70 factor (ECF subfamily)
MTSPPRFERLLAPYHEAARAFARGLCRSRADGDDLFHAAVTRAIAKVDQLREDDAFKPWFYRIVISVHRNRSRTAFWRRLVPLLDDRRAAGPALDDALGGADRARLALARLPVEQRETVVLFELEQWTVAEIAELHDVTISAVKTRLARGRERLRAFYVRELGIADAPRATSPGGVP